MAYLAVWMDLYSKGIVGWQLDTHIWEELVITSLNKALYTKGMKPGLIIHLDLSGQYVGGAFRK